MTKNSKIYNWVVYFTATFPYVILLILVIRGCTLDGAIEGINYYINPKWSELSRPQVWSTAAVQIFYSLGIAFGSLMSFSSYNNFKNNIIRDTLIVSIGNCCTSVFAGFAIFSVLGHMATVQGVNVTDVADSGAGLAFVAYPQAVALLPIPQLWSILFFFMLITLGLDSQFGMVEAVLTGLMDEFPGSFRKWKKSFTVVVCIIGFLMGLIMVTPGGFYWLNLYNNYSAWYGLLFLALLFCVILYLGYGFLFTFPWRFDKDVKLMLGNSKMVRVVLWYFRVCWSFVTPVMLLFVIVMACLSYGPTSVYGLQNPKWADDLGMCMSVSVVAIVPIYAVIAIIMKVIKGESVMSLLKPDPSFRPANRDIPYDHLTGEIVRTDLPTYTKTVSDAIPDAYPHQGAQDQRV